MTDTFWIVEGDDSGGSDLGETIGRYVDDLFGPPEPGQVLRVEEYRRQPFPEKPGYFLDLEYVLERLDEEHGNPDEATKPTPAMVAALDAFWAVMAREYRVWRGEQTGRVEVVDLTAWCRENAPEVFDGK